MLYYPDPRECPVTALNATAVTVSSKQFSSGHATLRQRRINDVMCPLGLNLFLYAR